MSNTPFFIPSWQGDDKFKDYRDSIPGDSYNWDFVNVLKNWIGIAIHHSAGPSDQTPDEIANYHIYSRKWGGVGYHFIVTSDGKIWYVGDLGTGRAHVANLNHKYIGICMTGCFMGDVVPTKKQLLAVYELCKELINDGRFTGITASGINGIVPHRSLSATACPGDTYKQWFDKIKTGDIIPQEDWKKKYENLKEIYDKAINSISGLEEKIKSLIHRAETAESNASHFESLYQTAKTDLETAEGKIKKLQPIVDNWEKEKDTMQKELDELRKIKYGVSYKVGLVLVKVVEKIKEVIIRKGGEK